MTVKENIIKRNNIIVFELRKVEGITRKKFVAKISYEQGIGHLSINQSIDDLILLGLIDETQNCLFIAEKKIEVIPVKDEASKEADALFDSLKGAEPI